MAWDHQKSGVTICLDVIRNVAILVGTGWVTVLLWRYNWILGLVVVIPIYLILLNVIGLLALPLYRFTPENRLKARMHEAIMSGDLQKGKELTDEFIARFKVDVPVDTNAALETAGEPDPELQRLRTDVDAARNEFKDYLERERRLKARSAGEKGDPPSAV
jgi:hypothetical protein